MYDLVYLPSLDDLVYAESDEESDDNNCFNLSSNTTFFFKF